MSDEPQAAATDQQVEEAIQYAKKYLEDLLSFFGLNTAQTNGAIIKVTTPGPEGPGLRSSQGPGFQPHGFLLPASVRQRGSIHRPTPDVLRLVRQGLPGPCA